MQPLAKPLAAIQQELRNLLLEDLPEAHKALKELLPEGTAKHSSVITLQGRLHIHIQSLRGCRAIN